MLEEEPGSKAVQPLSLEVSKKMEKSLSLTRILNLLRLAYRHPKVPPQLLCERADFMVVPEYAEEPKPFLKLPRVTWRH